MKHWIPNNHALHLLPAVHNIIIIINTHTHTTIAIKLHSNANVGQKNNTANRMKTKWFISSKRSKNLFEKKLAQFRSSVCVRVWEIPNNEDDLFTKWDRHILCHWYHCDRNFRMWLSGEVLFDDLWFTFLFSFFTMSIFSSLSMTVCSTSIRCWCGFL